MTLPLQSKWSPLPLRRLALNLTLALGLTSAAAAENWPQWRGPHGNGATTETNLPATWDETDNVDWQIPLPGPASSTPIVWDDNIFLLDLDEDAESISALCLDLNTGKPRWSAPLTKDRKYPLNNLGSPSPVTNGKLVAFLTGNGQLHAFTLSGEPLWNLDLEQKYGKFVLQFGFSSSPLLHHDTIFFQLLQNTRPNRYGRSEALPGKTLPETIPSHILALNANTGEILWEQTHQTIGKDESLEAYSSPSIRSVDGHDELLILGGDVLTAFDPKTGTELWRWGSYNPNENSNLRMVPSPLTFQDLVYVPGPKHTIFYAVRPTGNGNLAKEAIAWTNPDISPDASTPLLYKDRLYVLDDDKRILTCQNPRTGEVFWTGKIDFRAVIRASLTGADDKIYCMSERAEVAVVRASDEKFEILHQIDMDARPSRATIVAAQGKILIRTANRLVCISNHP